MKIWKRIFFKISRQVDKIPTAVSLKIFLIEQWRKQKLLTIKLSSPFDDYNVEPIFLFLYFYSNQSRHIPLSLHSLLAKHVSLTQCTLSRREAWRQPGGGAPS